MSAESPGTMAERGAAEVLFERRDPTSGIDQVSAEELLERIRELVEFPARRHERPANLVHVLLDNGRHESTGGQATVSHGTSLARRNL